MVPSIHVEVSSSKKVIEDCEASSSQSSVSLPQSEKRRHSSSSDKEKLSSANKLQLPPKRRCSGNATPNRQFLHIASQDGMEN